MRMMIVSTNRADRNLYRPLIEQLEHEQVEVVYSISERPNLAFVLGDRSEMLEATIPIVRLGIPVAHIGGGEHTFGSLDEKYRYAISRLATLHFVSLPDHDLCLRGAGIWDHIYVVGCLSVDAAESAKRALGPARGGDGILATIHPETAENVPVKDFARIFQAALDGIGMPMVWTQSCPDIGKNAIDSQLPLLSGRIIGDAGFDYYRLMARADVMVGNSSSGFTEAASFGLPVVNVGTRQRGRVPQPNIINVNWDAGEIRDAIVYATAPGYRDKLKDELNAYGDGCAAERIVRIAKEYLRRKK